MNDDAGRPDELADGRARSTGEQQGAEAGASWFTGTDGQAVPTQAAADPGPASPQARPSPEQRYADAIKAMNEIISTLDFARLPWVTEVFRATAGVLDDRDPARAGVLNNLGSASQLMYLSSRQPGDLEDAVTYYRDAASQADQGDPDLVLYQCNLALALTELATSSGSVGHAEESVRAARTATEQTPRRDPRRIMTLVRLANALKTHARLAEDPRSDDQSIDAFREAARAASRGGGAEAAELRINLGAALLRRYQRTGSPQDLDEGITHLRRGADGLADGEPRRNALCHLASALRLRFEQAGDLADLEAGIGELVGVLGVLTAGHPLLGRALVLLAESTAEHVDSTGEPGPLRRTLRAYSASARGMAPDDPEQPFALAGYGALLRRHFLHGAEADALDTAVAAGEASVESSQNGKVLHSLALSLLTRYENSADEADLDRAEHVCQQAAAAAETAQHLAWAQLGVISAHRFRRTTRTGELETAVEWFDRALEAMSADAPERAAVATHLGRALQSLHQRTGRRRFYRWARRVLAEAAAQTSAAADQRLRAASLNGRLAAGAQRWSEAVESFTSAVELLPLVTRAKRAVASPAMQQRWALIAADAAACAVENGEPERAVELLEHGRVALLSDFLPAGGELGGLHRDHPELADEAVRLRRLLDRPPGEPALTDPEEGVALRARLVDAWEDLLREVRSDPAHAGHLRLRPFAELAGNGADGSVVLVNLSRYRSDALILFAGRVMTVPLPGAGPDSAAEQARAALAATDQRDQGALLEALDWSWHNITRPVLDRMGYVQQPAEGQRWPRMWWYVLGALSFLPLHAAASKDGASALDRVVSSYAPSLSTLNETRRRPVPDGGRALVAADSLDPGARELPRENQILARYWPDAEVLSPRSTSSVEVQQLLPDTAWVHVCEPSAQYPGQPAAGLVLDREPPQRGLGVVELGQMGLHQVEFGYLGRCSTFVDAPSAAAVPLASALGFAGFAHVIGTLWEVDEECALEVHSEVYEAVFGTEEFDTGQAAHALHEAARRLRADFPEAPSRWSAHLHVGP
ncbi:CHAT domain-containing protein [Saccharopolyspora sp. NFXS83]|uniref:CHAT domain-containing protein n=1 Tax=Saccharopolyspora sp. NFXS83 TaxID=2993560 RepID=UPI00224B6C68|nr:CHAT domain-containing protein [Saccharopolyspora sp. NFXS83]MCX2728986.1 CHAT domain-containing protein [Saccharopolyspora sp. NFXS83]